MRLLCALLALLCALTATAPARGGDVQFAGVLPNGALYARNVESMQEARYRYIVRQQTDYSCGAAALATILRYGYGMNVDERLVIQGLMGVSDPEQVAKRGFSLLDIKRYVQELGLRGRGYRVSVERLHTLRVPTIVLMDVNGFSHFVVLKQVQGDTVEIADPMLGNRSLPLKDFLREWPSRALFVVIGSGFDRQTALLKPMQKPSARALYARRGPISDAELLDFGFTNADLF
ncbi:C39 family peptidase [Oleiagrimonas soli]|uniref:Peptidase n=1 Tax=Oleiagrimonas soli TaxID=1543381 RepID=A0A099CS99_9GAMM|nr:C39 family peptidase [Oleiagrimonas soli]KGI76649.1 peptidase [Oleiagrimonas soli]MBB6185145.1 hypothetical protein [Oleiagrimonas soli]